jgi:hypothetical protein
VSGDDEQGKSAPERPSAGWFEVAPSAPRDTDLAGHEPYTTPGFVLARDEVDDGTARAAFPLRGSGGGVADEPPVPPFEVEPQRSSPIPGDNGDGAEPDEALTRDERRPPPFEERRGDRTPGDDHTPAFKTAPGAPYPGPFGGDATEHGPSPGATRAMAPLPGVSPPAAAMQRLTTGAEQGGGLHPVMPPDPTRLFDDRLPPSHAGRGRSGVPALAPTQATSMSRRRASIVAMAVVVFVFCFVGTGSLFWWLAARSGADAGPGEVSRAPARVAGRPMEIPRLPPPPPGLPTTPATSNASASAPPAVTPPVPDVTSTPVAAGASAAGPRAAAERLVREGDVEAERIAPHLAIANRDALDAAIAVPRGHYDAAQARYREALRHGGGLEQCALARMGVAAERLAGALEATATAPEVLALDASRFPRELLDGAAAYRNVARRYYREALAAAPALPDCERLARDGLARLENLPR